jgi:hypothetical protein
MRAARRREGRRTIAAGMAVSVAIARFFGGAEGKEAWDEFCGAFED